jgi:hypothetical protein
VRQLLNKYAFYFLFTSTQQRKSEVVSSTFDCFVWERAIVCIVWNFTVQKSGHSCILKEAKTTIIEARLCHQENQQVGAVEYSKSIFKKIAMGLKNSIAIFQ